MLPRIILASLRTRKTSASLIVVAIALSLVMIVGIERLRHQVRANFASTVSGIDLIVSARGGPMNILLYSVFRLSDPTAGIRWDTVEHLADHPDVLALVLGAGGDGAPGPLVTHFSAHSGGLPCPLVILPGAMPMEDIERIASA